MTDPSLSTATPTPTLLVLAEAIASAGFVASIGYAKNLAETGEPFDATRYGATVIVGLGLGIAAVLAGTPLSDAELSTRLLAYSGLVYLVESTIKTIVRSARETPHTSA